MVIFLIITQFLLACSGMKSCLPILKKRGGFQEESDMQCQTATTTLPKAISIISIDNWSYRTTFKTLGQVFGSAVETPPGIPTSLIGQPVFKCQLSFWLQLPANEHPGRQLVMAQRPGSVPHMWKTQFEFLLPDPILTIVDIWGVNQQMEVLSLCLCVSVCVI